MNDESKNERPIGTATAAARSDATQGTHVESAGDPPARLGLHDPLIGLLDLTAKEAREAGLTEADIDAELDAYNAERRG